MSFFRTFINNPSPGSLFSAIVSERSVLVEQDISYGSHHRHCLDVYRPKITKKTKKQNPPIIVFYYGGGWDSGDRQSYGFVGSALASRGFITVIPDYRVYPEVQYPAFMSDAAQAYDWVVTNRTIENNKPQIFVMGHSAGAHIGALLTYDRQHLRANNKELPKPDGFIGLSGPYGFDPTQHQRSKHIFQSVKTASEVQPVMQVKKGAPPALLIHGGKDTTVLTLNALRMRDALREVGTSAEAIEIKNLGHIGPILALSKPYRLLSPVLHLVTEFISSQ